MSAVPQSIHDVPDDSLAAIEYCYEQGWTDGLPVVPPEKVASRLCSRLRVGHLKRC